MGWGVFSDNKPPNQANLSPLLIDNYPPLNKEGGNLSPLNDGLDFNPCDIYTLHDVRENFELDSITKDWNSDNFIMLKREFETWSDDATYIVYENKDGLFEHHRASKRGNDVYRYRTEKRIRVLDRIFTENPNLIKDYHVIFFTLTYNRLVTCNNKHKAWLRVSKDWNNFITKFRKEYGHSFAFRVIESHQDGFPHLQGMLISEHSFKPFLDRHGTLRAIEKTKITNLWSLGFVDIKLVESVPELVRYLKKDLIKSFSKYRTARDTLTLALNWFYRKRAIAISGIPTLNRLKIPDLISGFSVIQTEDVLNQISEGKSRGLRFIGIVSLSFHNGLEPPDHFLSKPYGFELKDVDLVETEF